MMLTKQTLSPHSLIARRRTTTMMLLVLALSLATGVARASNSFYLPLGHSVQFLQREWKTIPVVRVGTDTETLSISLTGSSRFSCNSAVRFVPDTGQDTVRWFYVNFNPLTHDTSYATIILRGHTWIDTIYVTGHDTSHAILPPPPTDCFSIDLLSGHGHFTMSDHDSNGSWPLLSDSSLYPCNVTSKIHAPIQVRVHIIGDSGWSILSTYASDTIFGAMRQDAHINIENAQYGYAGHQIMWVYHDHGVRYDTARVVFSTASNCIQSDTELLTMDYNVKPHTQHMLAVPDVDLGTLGIGDSVCQSFVISNYSADTLTIDSIVVNNWFPSYDHWTWSGLPSLPLALATGSQTSFTACFKATSYGRGAVLYVTTYFHDPSHLAAGVRSGVYVRSTPLWYANPDTLLFNDVITGGYVEKAVTLYHQQNDTSTGMLTSLLPEHSDTEGIWNILGLPVATHRFDTIQATVRWSPKHDGDQWQLYYLSSYSGPSPGITLIGHAVHSTADTMKLFAPPQKSLLAMRSEHATVTKTFTFTNNSSSAIRVTNVYVLSGAHFSVLAVHPHAAPDTLQVGDALSVDVQFDGNQNGFYHDSLVVLFENALTPLYFDLEAVQEGSAAAVAETVAPANVQLFVSPNPSHGTVSVAVRNARSASIEIYDLLGRKITAFMDHLTCVWEAPSNDAGVYVIRAIGVEENGTPFVASRRVVVEK